MFPFGKRSERFIPKLAEESVATFDLGCETCPNRKSVCVPGLASVALLGFGRVPITVTFNGEASIEAGKRVVPIEVGPISVTSGEKCELRSHGTICPNEDDIEKHYEHMSAHPEVLNAQLNEGKE